MDQINAGFKSAQVKSTCLPFKNDLSGGIVNLVGVTRCKAYNLENAIRGVWIDANLVGEFIEAHARTHIKNDCSW